MAGGEQQQQQQPTEAPRWRQRHTEELRQMAREAGEAAAINVFKMIGVDVSDPIQAQEDFAIMRGIVRLARDPEYRKDAEFVRELRKRDRDPHPDDSDRVSAEKADQEFVRVMRARAERWRSIRDKGFGTAMGALFVGLGSAAYLFIQSLLAGGPRPGGH